MENRNGEIINTKNVGNVLNNNVIIETLKNQRLLENEETEDQYILSQKDLDILSDLVSKELRSKGYKLSKKDEFNSKIETFFSINTKCNKYENLGSRYTVFHGNVMDGSEKTLNNNLYESFAETGNIFFDKENQLITNFFLLKTIISETNSNLTISVPENIIARNKYLFNSSKADYVWLMANDPSFLESLVKDFGYVKDNELDLFVIKKNFSDPEEFGKILSYQKCDGTIIINKNIFDIISKANEDDKSKYLRGVANYLVKESKEVALIKNISPSKLSS